MTTRKMKRLGIDISLLGFGCMRFPTLENGKINYEQTEQMIDTALANGVNYFDTAWPYHEGKSEPAVGEILKKKNRDSFYIATKLPCWDIKEKKDVCRIFEQQLQRLQMKHIDFYLLHAIGRNSFNKMLEIGALDLCLELQKQGKIKYLGFSFHGSYEEFEYIINYREWDFCQIQLNYMDMEEQAGRKGYDLAEEKGVPVIAMEPVKGGSLANLPEEIKGIFDKFDPQASCSSWALRFVGSLKNVKVILSGMSNLEQVQDNISTFQNFKPISGEEEKAIVDVANALKERVKNGCTNCKYCMPCPAGVNIPENFSAWNQYHIYHNKGLLNWVWSHGLKEEAKAKNCTGCGACENACPQKIPIREDLKMVQKEIEEVLEISI